MRRGRGKSPPNETGSDCAAVIGPVQQRLPLSAAAEQVAGLAVFLNLADVTADRLPAPDLPAVLCGHAAAHVIAAVPLKPSARIVGMDPAFPFPFRQRLAGVDAEEIAFAVVAARRQPGPCEPAFGKFAPTVGHVLA